MEIIIHIQSAKTLDRLKEVVKNIREIEKEYNCHCTLLEVEIFDKRLMKAGECLM